MARRTTRPDLRRSSASTRRSSPPTAVASCHHRTGEVTRAQRARRRGCTTSRSHDPAGGVQRRRVRHRHHPACSGPCDRAVRHSLGACCRSVAVLPRLCRQLPHDRRSVARAHRDHRPSRGSRLRATQDQPLLLLVVAVLPFPTRLVAESFRDVEGERLFVAMYGAVFLAMRLLLMPSMRARGAARGARGRRLDGERRSILAVVVSYTVAILIALLAPAVAVGLYCAIAIVLVVPWSALRRSDAPQ